MIWGMSSPDKGGPGKDAIIEVCVVTAEVGWG